jgi:CPA2 family monovalent cation:H+ antiporter-2
LLDNVPFLVTMVLLVVVGKMVIRVGVVRLFGETPWTALLTGVGLAQIGEFSFVLVQAARREGYIGQDIYQATLATSLITILLNATLVQLVSRHIGSFRAARGPRNTAPRSRTLEGHVILCGYGRVGSAVAEALETFGVPYVTIETDPDIVRGLRTRGIPSLFGDASHARLLQAAGAEHAALAVVALPELDRVRLTVRKLRQANPSLPILARAQDRAHHTRLREAGRQRGIQPELEAASTLIRHALRRLDPPRERVLATSSSSERRWRWAALSPGRGRDPARAARGAARARPSPTARCTTHGSASASACRWSGSCAPSGTRVTSVGRHGPAPGRPRPAVRPGRAARRAARLRAGRLSERPGSHPRRSRPRDRSQMVV